MSSGLLRLLITTKPLISPAGRQNQMPCGILHLGCCAYHKLEGGRKRGS